MSISKINSAEIANGLLLRVFAYFCGLFAYFCRFFAYVFVCGLEHLGINTLHFYHTTEQMQYVFVVRGRSGGPCLNGGAGEQEQYLTIDSVCAYLTLNVVPQASLMV